MDVVRCGTGPVEYSNLEDSDGPTEPMLKVVVSNELRLSGDVRSEVIEALREELRVENPERANLKKIGNNYKHLPKYLEYLEECDGYWAMPQGCMDRLITQLTSHSCFYELDFPLKTSISPFTKYEFLGELRPDQKLAAEKALRRPYGVLRLPTGAGKTVVALYCIAKRIQTALIVVHRKELLSQWQERITEFLGIPKSEIGQVGGGKWKVGEKITVAMMPTLASKKRDISELVNRTSFLIVDECHHVPAKQFRKVVSQFRCRYMLGLSATPERTDGLDDVIHFFMGDLCHSDSSEQSFKRGDTLRPVVYTVQTDFRFNYTGDHLAMLSAITEDTDRLKTIVQTVGYFISDGGTPLIVSDRVEYCRKIAMALEHLMDDEVKVGLLIGDVPPQERERIIAGIRSGEIGALVATGSLIGEGFDCKELDGLFITTPFKAAPKVKQMVGRIVRPAEGKRTPEIYDFVDRDWKCQEWHQERRVVYEDEGYTFG